MQTLPRRCHWPHDMNSKSSALMTAFNEARLWQLIGCACLAVMILETLYLCHLNFALWACRAG